MSAIDRHLAPETMPELVSVHRFGQLMIALHDGKLLAVALVTNLTRDDVLVLRSDEEIDPTDNSFKTRKKRKEEHAP